MADEPAQPDPQEPATPPADDVERVPYERFAKANQKAKEAADRATKLERDMADLKAQLEDREAKGLPELDQLKKRLEQAERRAQEAERKAEETERSASRIKREQWVARAASQANFRDPEDAARYVDLDEIEDPDQAERAIKRVAKAKSYLLKEEDPKLPGRVLENGQPAKAGAREGDIDLNSEAHGLAAALKEYAGRGWQSLG